MDVDFWQALDRLVAGARVVIDRPRGSRHPRYPELVYPLDYGYLEGTRAADGGGIDACEPRVTAVVVTIDALKRDAEIKLLLGCTPSEARLIAAFHNSGSQSGLLVER